MEERRRGSWASSPLVRRIMQANRAAETGPERRIRSLLFRMGLRYRKQYPAPPNGRSRIDIAFPRERVAVFINGCFWHGCPEHATWPKRNAEYWSAKVLANRQRDASIDAALSEAGWLVLRIWEHEDPSTAAARIAEAVLQRRRQSDVSIPLELCDAEAGARRCDP